MLVADLLSIAFHLKVISFLSPVKSAIELFSDILGGVVSWGGNCGESCVGMGAGVGAGAGAGAGGINSLIQPGKKKKNEVIRKATIK